MQEKICNKCGVSKTLDNFHLSKTCKYGVRNTCKKCRVVEKEEPQSSKKSKSLSKNFNSLWMNLI